MAECVAAVNWWCLHCALHPLKGVLLIVFYNMFFGAICFLAALKLSFIVSAIYIHPEKYVVADIQHDLSAKHEAQMQC